MGEATLTIDELPGGPPAGANASDRGPFVFTIATSADTATLQIPIHFAGPESWSISMAQERWVGATFPGLECVFAGVWRSPVGAAWDAVVATLERLARPGPSVAAQMAFWDWRVGSAPDPTELEALIVANPSWVEPRVARAQRRLDAHADSPGARDDAEAVLAMSAEHLGALMVLGQAHLADKAWEQAVAAFVRATASAPEAGSAWQARAWAEERAGLLPAALESLERAIAIDPETPHLFMRKAGVLIAQGQPEAALGACRAARRIAPDYLPAWTLEARTLWGMPERATEALAAANEAVVRAQVAPWIGDWESLLLRGGILRWLGRFDEARADLDACLARYPECVVAWGERGLVREALGDGAGALEDLDRYLAVVSWEPAIAARARLRPAVADSPP